MVQFESIRISGHFRLTLFWMSGRVWVWIIQFGFQVTVSSAKSN